MEEQEDTLGLLFKNSFEGHKPPLEEGEWDMLSNSLEKRNFFKFNPYQFNIYYASTILACFFICLGVGSHYVYKQHPFSASNSETSTVLSDTSATHVLGEGKKIRAEDPQEEFNSEPHVPYSRVEEKKVEKKPTEEKTVSEPSQVPSNSLTSKKDTITHSVVHKTNPQPTIDSSKINKKVLYITKQDTIFKYDTVRTHKPRKKWLK